MSHARRYFKKPIIVTAIVAAERMEVTDEQRTYTIERGDRIILTENGYLWSVKPDIFADTYRELTPGRFMKMPTPVTAEQATEPTEIESPEGVAVAQVGDYIVTGVHGEQYVIPRQKFEATYEPFEWKQIGG